MISPAQSILTSLAFWLLVYTLLVFGSEVAVRSVLRPRFRARGRFSVSICWSTVAVLMIATWIPSRVTKNPNDKCVATLLSWVTPWARGALALNAVAVVLLLLLASLIAFQLSRTSKAERDERVGASIAVYYLGLGGLLMIAVLPYWVRAIAQKSTNGAAATATIALNIYGLLSSLLYLILKSNAKNITFRPAGGSWDQSQEWRFFGSPRLDLGRHMTHPVGAHHSNNFSQFAFSIKEKGDITSQTTISRVSSRGTRKSRRNPSGSPPGYRTPASTHKSSISKPVPASPPAYRTPPLLNSSDPLLQTTPELPQLATPVFRSDSGYQSSNKSNYGLFPPRKDSLRKGSRTREIPRKPVSTRVPLFFNAHKRDTSDVSGAMVQIGMRLSGLPMEADPRDGLRRSTTYPAANETGRLVRLKSPSPLAPLSLNAMLHAPLNSHSAQAKPGSPCEILFRLNSQEELSPHPVQPATRSLARPLEDLISPTRKLTAWRQFRDTRMKSLPPVPATPTSAMPTSALRASYPEPGTPVSLTSTVRASRDRAALSVALREDESWPLQAVAVPNKTYLPDKRSWI